MYDIHGHLQTFKLEEPFSNKGGSANVYLIDDKKIVFKKYKNKMVLYRVIDFEIFDFLKACDNPHIFNLLETYYCRDGILKKMKLRCIPKKVLIDAYTYEYVETSRERLIDRPTDYFLTNLSELESFLDYLANYHILVHDLSVDNVILNENRMVLIDPDMFRFRTDISRERIRFLNRKALLELYENIIIYERKRNELELETLLLNVNANKEDLASQASKQLSMCKKPTDYIVRKKF